MIQWKKEGEAIRQGISIYHPKDKSSFGGTSVSVIVCGELAIVKLSKNGFYATIKLIPPK